MSSVSSRAQSLYQMIRKGAPSTQSEAWMHHVTSWYNALSDDEKNEVLETLIAASGPHQMLMLQRKFPDLLFRDFIGLLPPELAVIILSYLDGETLLTCCLVSKRWDDIISNLPSVWWRVARDNGVMMPQGRAAADCESTEQSNTAENLESDTDLQETSNDKEAENNERLNTDIVNNQGAGKTLELQNEEQKEQDSVSNPGEENNSELLNNKEVKEQNSEDRSLSNEIDTISECNALLNIEALECDSDKGTRLDSRYVRDLYCHSKRVIRGFNNGTSINIKEHFIDKATWRVTSVKYHQGNVVTGCDDHTVQVWSVPGGDLLTSVSTHSVCCLTITQRHVYTASFNANAECWDISTGQHSKTFVGHTSAVLAIDVSCDEHFLLTGSVDRTAKLWDLQKSSSEHLLRTFDDIHMDWVFQVKFLSVCESSLLFISCDAMVCCVWRVTPEGRVLSSSHVVADRSTKFTSFYLSPGSSANIPSSHSSSSGTGAQHSDIPCSSTGNVPSNFVGSIGNTTSKCVPDTDGAPRVETLSACQWTEMAKASVFVQYSVDLELGQLQRVKSFRIWLDAIKAHLLGAGRRFAVIMCAISRRNFHILDIQKESVIATIVTPDFYILTRNGSTVTLCDTSWLDGFDFTKMTSETPVFAASVALNRVMLGTWGDFVSNVEYNEPDSPIAASQDSESVAEQKCCGRTIEDADMYDDDRRIIDEFLMMEDGEVGGIERDEHLVRRIRQMIGRDERIARRLFNRAMMGMGAMRW